MSEVSQPNKQMKPGEYSSLVDQLQQTREELRQVSELQSIAANNCENLITELEQVKAERDYALRGSTCDACRGVIGENDKLRTELSAKDKVLEWYADTNNYRQPYPFAMLIEVDEGSNARSILSRYRGEAQ